MFEASTAPRNNFLMNIFNHRAIGCVIFELIELKKPFRGKTFYEICQSIASDEPEFERKDLDDSSLKSLVKL